MSDTIFLKNLHDISRFGELPSNWQSTTIRQICELGRGRVISQEEINEHPGPYPVYSSQTSNNGEMGYLNSFDFEGEWITWTTDGANAGTVFYRSGRFNCTNVCGTLSAKTEGSTDLRFLHYHLGKIAKNYVSYLGNPKLMNDVVGSIALHLPPLPEQKKIARILTTVDNLIEKTEALIEKYKAIKQGMMHDLFTRGVDQNGKLRPPYEEAPHLYKESPLGWIPKEWEATELGSACTWMSGGTPSKSIRSYWQGEVPWASPKDMKTFELYDTIDHISEEGARAGSRLLTKGTVLIVIRGMILAHTFPVAIVCRRMAFNQDMKALVCNPAFQHRFLAYWLIANSNHLLRLATESTHGTKRFDLSDLYKLPFPFPSTDEQAAITDRLDAVDGVTNAEENRLRNLKVQKNGLMQDLLTGKVRVKVDEVEEELANA